MMEWWTESNIQSVQPKEVSTVNCVGFLDSYMHDIAAIHEVTRCYTTTDVCTGSMICGVNGKKKFLIMYL